MWWDRLRAVIAATALLAGGAMSARAEEKPAEAASAPSSKLVPPQPAELAAAKAYAVLDQHCARCHQTGRLKHPRPAHGLANILDLAAIAANPALVSPGTPDASPLYTQMLLREMPFDTYHGAGGDEPTPDELQAVRDWIQDLPRPSRESCGDRQPISQDAVEAAIAKALEAQPEERRKDMRFATLTHLYNACVPVARLEAYRQAVARMLNSLSWSPAAVRPVPADEHGTVLRIDLAALGWVAGHWDQLAQVYPYAAVAGVEATAATREATGSAVPAIRADWLAATAMRAPLYQSLLGLPARHGDLQRVLSFDAEAGIKSGTARRAGIRESRVIRANRMIERHVIKSGSAWIAHDFATSTGRQSIVDHPVGPTQSVGGRQPFRADATRTIFTLPNGFPAFAQHDGRGERIDAAPAGIERDQVRWGGAQGVGLGCMGCHASGPIKARDELRAIAETDRTYPKELRDAVLTAHAGEAELDKLVDDDVARLREMLATAGIDADLAVDGVDPLSALAHEHTGPLDLRRAAAEFGLSPAELRQRLSAVDGELKPAALRLRYGVATRAEVDQIGRLVTGGAAAQAAAGTGEARPAASSRPAEPAKPGGRLDLVVWSDRDTYKSGQLATFYARASADCHLTLVSIDPAGKATVLFPNEFEPANQLTAGVELRLPGQGAPYQFRLKDKGRETLVGVCSVIAKSADGIQHDYERQRFTMLGNWRNFIHQASAEDTGERRSQAESRQPEVKGRNKRRSRTKQPEAKPEAVKAREQQARTAITYEVQ